MSHPQQDYYANLGASPEPPPKPKMSWGKVLVFGCLGVTVFGGMVFAVCLYLGWSTFVRFGIRDDIEEYESDLQACEMQEAVRSNLLQRFDAVHDTVDGRNFGLMDWIAHDETFDSILKDQQVTSAELERLDRELGKIENALGLPVGAIPKTPPHE